VKAWLLVLAACGSTPPKPAPAHHAAPAVSQVERGLDFERGRGVARDYRKAVAVYREACRDGCGELASCQRLFKRAAVDRGIVIEGREMATLASRLCDRHDMNGCIASLLMGVRDDTAIIKRGPEAGLKACEAGDLGACQLIELSAGFNFGGSSTVEDRGHRAEEKACQLGDLDGCVERMKHELNACGEQDASACIEAKLAMLRTGWGTSADDQKQFDEMAGELRAIAHTTITACTDGDADACEAIHRDLPRAQLCDAGNYDACRKLAESGDDHAKQLACAAGIDVGCAVKVPPRVAPRDYAQSLLFLRQQCTQMKDQQACDLLAKETAPARCR
jgi:TPR repeat protein